MPLVQIKPSGQGAHRGGAARRNLPGSKDVAAGEQVALPFCGAGLAEIGARSACVCVGRVDRAGRAGRLAVAEAVECQGGAVYARRCAVIGRVLTQRAAELARGLAPGGTGADSKCACRVNTWRRCHVRSWSRQGRQPNVPAVGA